MCLWSPSCIPRLWLMTQSLQQLYYSYHAVVLAVSLNLWPAAHSSTDKCSGWLKGWLTAGTGSWEGKICAEQYCHQTHPTIKSSSGAMWWEQRTGKLGLESNKEEKVFLDKVHGRELHITICLTHLTSVSKPMFFSAWCQALFSFISVL